jgi:uncharacterized protein (DUF2164 family)
MQNTITKDLWQYTKTNKTKIAKQVYNWLNKDTLLNIEVYDDMFWLEFTYSYASIPNYIYTWLIHWIEKNYNLKYWYNK